MGIRLLLVLALLVGVKLIGPYHLIDDDVHVIQDLDRDLGEYLTLYAREPVDGIRSAHRPGRGPAAVS